MVKQRLRTFTVSLLFSYIFSGLMLLMLALVLYKFRLKEKQVETCVYLIYALSCLFGGFLAGKGMKSRRMLWGLLIAAAYFLILFLVSYFISRNDVKSSSDILISFTFCCGGGITGGVMS